MSLIKKIIISLVIGLIGFELASLVIDGQFVLPVTTPDISLLLIFVATSLATALLPGAGSVSSATPLDGDRESGTVKWFNVRKGYGFITRDQGEDVFVHFRNIEGEDRRGISEGQRVSFVVTDGDKGLQADKVTPA